MLDDRKAAILAALVEDYISSGTPVSSRVILERSGLDCSTATIRNELVRLEREGYVTQPHTSAGRVPSDLGYRYYVDHLAKGPLRASTRGRIESFFGTIHAEFGRILEETTDLLSDLTSYPSVALGPGLRGRIVRDIHLLPVDAEAALLVVICEAGHIFQDVVRPGLAVAGSDIEGALEVIKAKSVGRPLGDQEDLGDIELPPAVLALVDEAFSAASAAAATDRDLYVGGTSRLAELWEDLSELHRVLALLEGKTGVLELLGGRSEGLQVRLGSETQTGETDLAVVSAAYRAPGAVGRVGVLGPKRMDYRRTIRVVEEVSDALGDSLST